MSPAIFLAHQGGWDEMLLVAAPIAIFYLILRAANRRAQRMVPPDQEPHTSVVDPLD